MSRINLILLLTVFFLSAAFIYSQDNTVDQMMSNSQTKDQIMEYMIGHQDVMQQFMSKIMSNEEAWNSMMSYMMTNKNTRTSMMDHIFLKVAKDKTLYQDLQNYLENNIDTMNMIQEMMGTTLHGAMHSRAMMTRDRNQ